MHFLLPILLSVALGGPAPSGDSGVRPDQIAFDSVFVPVDTVDTATVFACWARLKNYSDFYIGGWAYLRFSDSAQNRTYYAESSRFFVPPYGYDTADFRSVRFRVLGAFCAWLWLPGGDTIRSRFWVAPVAGVEESPEPGAPSFKLAATVLRRLPGGVVVFDAMGRRVLDPKPGVYFVRAESGELSAAGCRKVVLYR